MGKQRQLGLFDAPTLNVSRAVKEAMNAAARDCGKSREQIADAMNDLADRYGIGLRKGNGRGLTVDTLEKWLNPADKSRPVPLAALPVFCVVVDDFTALAELARPLGLQVIGAADQRKLRWADAYRRVRDGRKTMRKLETDMDWE